MVLNSFMPRPLNDQGEVKKEMLNTAFTIPVYVRINGMQKVSAEIKEIEIAGNSGNFSVIFERISK